MRQGVVGQGRDSVSWLHADHLGSVSEVTSATGGRIAQERYYPYGRVRWGSAPTSYNFTGQRLDQSTGLLFFQARYYDPDLHRFLQPDTIVPEPGNPQSLNRFAYNYNNPLKYIDPTGHDPWLAGIGQFFGQALYQWVRSNREGVIILPMSPQEQQVWESLKVDTDEGRAGRIVGGLAAAVQGVVEFGAGAGAIGGGVAACGTGVLCVAGAPAIGLGAVGVVHGGGTAISGVGAAGQEIGWFLAQVSSGGRAGPNIDALIDAAAAPNPSKRGFTVAGHALQKHSNRPGSLFSKPSGTLNPDAYNAAAQDVIRGILTDPGTKMWDYFSRSFKANVLEFVAPDGRSVLYYRDTGQFIGFYEHPTGP